MSKSRFSREAQDVFARYTIDENALSGAYDDAFKRAFVQARESDTRDEGKEMEAKLARARVGLDRLTQELGDRFATSEESLTEALGKARTQGEIISALAREDERTFAVAEPGRDEHGGLRLHDAWSRTIKHYLKEKAQSLRAEHRLLLEASAYGFVSVAKHNDREEGYAFVLKSLARLAADFAQSVPLLLLAANLRDLCCRIDCRLTGAGNALHAEALELYCELTELTLEQLASE
jgi:hypothetical protein